MHRMNDSVQRALTDGEELLKMLDENERFRREWWRTHKAVTTRRTVSPEGIWRTDQQIVRSHPKGR